MVDRQMTLLIALVEKRGAEAMDPDEAIRREARGRLDEAFKILAGREWLTYRQLLLVSRVMADAASASRGEVDADRLVSWTVASDPALAGREVEVRAAMEGCARKKRLWPPLLDLLTAAGLAGGITDPDHLKRKFLDAFAKGMTDEDKAFFGR